MKMNAPRGTNDILPPLSLKWQYIEEAAKDINGKIQLSGNQDSNLRIYRVISEKYWRDH